MAGMEKSGNEILLEQLTRRVAQLTNEQKAKEAVVKELNGQIQIAERETATRVAAARNEADREIAALRVAVAPLKELVSTCERLRQDIEQLKKDKIIAVTEVKEAASGEIKIAEARVAAAVLRLNAHEIAIQRCKESVASL
jgi:chromosome segregation ATPase